MTLTPSRDAAVDEIQRRVNAHLRAAGPGPWSRYFTPHLVTGASSPLHDELNAWHRRELDRPPGAMDAVGAPRGHGKACSLGTVIPTPAGWTTMRDVQVGDYILGRDGAPTRVTHKSAILTDRRLYRVTFNTGEAVTVDADHEWTIEPRDAHPRTLTTEQLLTVNPARRRVPVADPLTLPALPLPIGPYTLGAWLSEGARAAGRLTLNDTDAAHIEERIRSEGETGHRVASSGTGAVGFRVDRLTTRLRDAGILGGRAVPAAYLRGSAAQRQALLEGIVDTDGSVSPAGQVEVTTTHSRAYADQLAELVHTLGMRCKVYEGRAVLNGRDVGPKWRVTWTPYRRVASLPRKVARCRLDGPQAARQAGRLIASITPAPTEPVQCVTVDAPDHLYLIGRGFIPTHNSPRASRSPPCGTPRPAPDGSP